MAVIRSTGKINFTLQLSVIIAAVFLTAVQTGIHISAEEIRLENANITFELPEGWYAAYDANMSEEILEKVGAAASDIENEFKIYNGCLTGSNSNRTVTLFILTASDEISQKIYNTESGSYRYISEYLNDPNVHMYIRNGSDVQVKKATEKITAQNCSFYLTEYTVKKEYGLCCSTVVNGKYISLDFRKVNGEFTDSERADLLNAVRSVTALEILEEEPLLDERQILLLGGTAFLLIILFVGIIVKRRRG